MRPLQCLKNLTILWQAQTALAACVLLISGAMTSLAQAPMAPMPASTSSGAGDQNKQAMDQIAELRAQVAKLQAAQMSPSQKKPMAKPGMDMGPGKTMSMPMGDKGEMGAMPA